jgi:hypothetical protein
MSESAHLLMLQFLTWVAERRPTYSEATSAWQSTCPRHTIWEDAIIDGYIEIVRNGERDPRVTVTARGVELLQTKIAL